MPRPSWWPGLRVAVALGVLGLAVTGLLLVLALLFAEHLDLLPALAALAAVALFAWAFNVVGDWLSGRRER